MPSCSGPDQDAELEPLTADFDMADHHHDSKSASVTVTPSYHDAPSASSFEPNGTSPTLTRTPSNPFDPSPTSTPHRVYKRRFLGLAQITLLNIIVSWNWLTFAPVSKTSSLYFNRSESAINWLSTGFQFAFVAASPAALWMLNRSVKGAMVTAAVLMVLGSWVRYAGARASQSTGVDGQEEGGIWALVVLGQLIIGLAQPFVLAAPTRFSDLWFTETGRISATAVASLGNPFGGALGQLIDPFWADTASEIPNMVLYVAILTTLITLPTFFLPARPPTPPTPTSLHSLSTRTRITFSTLTSLYRNPSFHLLTVPFVLYVSAFNATSSLLNQILEPYKFTEDEAGIGGALLIVVGLVAAAISSPLSDHYLAVPGRMKLLKVLVPVVAAMYTALIFTPGTRSLAGNYIVLSILGAASFCLVPLALELLVEVSWGDVGPEVSSTVAWTGGQLGGGVLILAMDALKGDSGEPRNSLKRGLILQAVVCWVAPVCVMFLGYWGTGRSRRGEAAARERERERESREEG